MLIINELTDYMVTATKDSLTENWDLAAGIMIVRINRFAKRLILMAELYNNGQISKDEILRHIEIQKKIWKAALSAVDGMSVARSEREIFIAINSVKNIFNEAVGASIL